MQWRVWGVGAACDVENSTRTIIKVGGCQQHGRPDLAGGYLHPRSWGWAGGQNEGGLRGESPPCQAAQGLGRREGCWWGRAGGCSPAPAPPCCWWWWRCCIWEGDLSEMRQTRKEKQTKKQNQKEQKNGGGKREKKEKKTQR